MASQSSDTEGSGGGIWANALTGTATIVNSTFTGNSADVNGGGIAMATGNVTLDQVTISGNTAGGAGDGLYLGYGDSEPPVPFAAGSARAKQHGEDAGPSAQAVGTVSVSGTIVAGNGDGTDDVAGAADGGNTATVAASVIGGVNDVTVTDAGGTQTGVTNPGLAPLANNGGPTQTMALLEGSPAIDKGPNPVATFPGNEFDQRGPGFARVVGAAVDVGAFEVQAPAPAPLVVTPRFTG
jgi:predicted outer membrane repeat protein